MNFSSKRNESLAGFGKGLLRYLETEERSPGGNYDKPKEAGPPHYSVGRCILCGMVALLMLVALVFLAIHQEVSLRRQELAALSNADHGATLDEFMSSVNKEGDVCYALFDRSGDKLFEYMEDYYGLGMYEQPDWPDAERLFDLAEFTQAYTEVHWHPGLVPTSILDDIYVSAQVKSKQLIIMEYDKTHYFRPDPDGWPEVAEMLSFQRCNCRNPFSKVLDRNYFEEMLEYFGIQHEIVPAK